MDASIIKMPKAEAKKHYEEYLEATKVRKEKYVEELKDLYRHLSEGAKVIDIYEVFKNSGVNEQGEPKLGIAPASSREIHFIKQELGAGKFNDSSWRDHKETVALPSGTFPEWKVLKEGEVRNNWEIGQIARKNVKAKVPLIPASLLPESKSLDGYYILFEVEQWDEVPTAKDPYLLKRINANAFVVLAEWNITPAELAVMRGL